MHDSDADIVETEARPRTATVLVWLTSASMVISYLIAYAFMGALASADLIDRWARDADPRPRWLLITFTTMTGTLVLMWLVARHLSSRQLRRIDEMEEESTDAQ
jgi:uncharacterized protein with von Willebrand factor type A (vWA) domain